MKRAYIVLVVLCLVFGKAQSQEQSVKQLSQEIIGKWKLLSFTSADNTKVDYQDQDVVWTFDGKKFSVASKDLKGRKEGKYYFRRSVFRVEDTYILKCNALTKTHLAHGKLVLKSVSKTKMIMGDWDDTVSYELQRLR